MVAAHSSEGREKVKGNVREWELCEIADPGCSQPQAAVSKP